MSNKHGSKWIKPAKRLAIYKRDGFKCIWCGATPLGLTLDHLFPKTSRYYDNSARRLVTACLPCNSSRKSLRLSAWLRMCPRGATLRLLSVRGVPLDMAWARQEQKRLSTPLADAEPIW